MMFLRSRVRVLKSNALVHQRTEAGPHRVTCVSPPLPIRMYGSISSDAVSSRVPSSEMRSLIRISLMGLSSAMILSPVEVNKKQFVGMSNLGKVQTKPTFRKSPSGFSFPLQVLSVGILRLRPRSPGARFQDGDKP